VTVDTSKCVDDIFVGQLRAASVVMTHMKKDVARAQHGGKFPFVVHDRKAPDLVDAHGVQRGVDFVVRMAHIKLPGHNLTYGQFGGPLVSGTKRDADIAVSNDADHLLRGVDHG